MRGEGPADSGARRRVRGAGSTPPQLVIALLARVGLAGAEELLRPGTPLGLGLCAARGFSRLGTILRRHQVLDLELLLGGQCEQLIGSLADLQAAFGTLA